MSVLADARVAELLVSCPTVHPADVTVGELRAFFLDDHKHMALLVDRGRLISTVERADLSSEMHDDLPARAIGTLRGRVLARDASAEQAFVSMREECRRRLAVIDERGGLVGLLCLKSREDGFCSDAGVTSRVLASTA